MEKQVNNDEIDLVELLVKMVLLLKRNLLQIIVFFLVGTGLGYAYASLAPKVYESKMMISSDILTESYSEKIFETLQDLVQERNYEGLISKLNIDESSAMSIGKITIESALKDKPSSEEAKKFFLITVELNDQNALPDLQNGILTFLRQNDFVKVRDEQKKKSFEELITKTQAEIESLEEFKANVYKGDFFKNNRGTVMFDPTEVNSKIVELTRQKGEYEKEFLEANSVQLVEGFTQFDKPVWPKKSVSLAAGATLGLFLVGIMIAFKSIRKLVRFAEEHPSQAIKN
ncbi:MAG: Wzz/FepE/Etk N-terminal domain-containing protein [Cyclobacteriaceae bacterium]